MIAAYIKYLLRSGNEHSIHSPFLFELYNNVIAVRKDDNPEYEAIRSLRKELLRSDEQIEILDLGAGSRAGSSSSAVTRWTLLSQLGRVNYNLLDRYLFTLTARRDGKEVLYRGDRDSDARILGELQDYLKNCC